MKWQQNLEKSLLLTSTPSNNQAHPQDLKIFFLIWQAIPTGHTEKHSSLNPESFALNYKKLLGSMNHF